MLQTVLLCAFSVGFLLSDGRRLFAGGVIGTVGAVLCASGLLLMMAALFSLRRVIQIAPEPRTDGQLVTRGVYSRLRHPIYTAIVIVVVGLFLRKPTVLVAIGAAVVVVFLMVKVRFEEKLLLGRYPEYAEYRSRTLGIIPWPRRRRSLISR